MASLLVFLSLLATTSSLFADDVNTTDFAYKGGCGQDNYGLFNVINGLEAKACQFPWMAYVNINWKAKGFRGFYGGSIISDKWIITAAHCIIVGDLTIPASAITVRTGSIHTSLGYTERQVDQVVIYPSYDRLLFKYDIALLRLNESIKWDGCHVPICLNKNMTAEESASLSCAVSGWGRTSTTRMAFPKFLLWAEDKIISRRECDNIYKGNSNNYTFCSRATANGRRGFCNGDSGGPLVCKSKKDGRFYQHGVVSLYLGERPCQMEGLYSSIAAFYSWIQKYVSDV